MKSKCFFISMMLILNLNLMAQESNKIVLKDTRFLKSPVLQLWADYPGIDKVVSTWNGQDLNDLRELNSGEETPPLTIGTMGTVLNSLMAPDEKYTLIVMIDLPQQEANSLESNKVFGVAAAVYANYDTDDKSFHFLDANNRISEIDAKDLAETKELLKGTQKVKPMGLQSWFGTKEEITGKKYNIEIPIDGSNPEFEFQDVKVKDFMLDLEYNFLLGKIYVNGVEIGFLNNLRPEGMPTKWEGSSMSYFMPNWTQFLVRGQNEISYEIYTGAEYKPHEDDFVIIKIIPYKSPVNFGLDSFNKSFFEKKITPDAGAWKLQVDVPDYPKRIWESAEKYDAIKHEELVLNAVSDLLAVIQKRDKQGMKALVEDYRKEINKFYQLDENYANDFIDYFENNHPEFSVLDIERSGIEINSYFDGQLIGIRSTQYQSLYWGYTTTDTGEQSYFELKKLPSYLIISNGKARFVL